MDEVIHIAACILTDDYGRILLLHRDHSGMRWWEVPGGKAEEGESLEAAAVREMQEELGVIVEVTGQIGKTPMEINDTQYELHWLSAEIAKGEPRIMETDSYNDLDYIDIEDLPSLSLSPGTQLLYEQLLTGEVQI